MAGKLLIIKTIDGNIHELVFPFGLLVQETNNIHECCLPGPRNPHENHELPALDFKVYPLENGEFSLPYKIALPDVFKGNHFFGPGEAL